MGSFSCPLSTEDIVDTFSRVRWTDTPEGMTADPGARFHLGLNYYLLTVPGIGTIQFESRGVSQTSGRIPAWKGHTTRTGELWTLPPVSDSGPPGLLMATDSAVVKLKPWDAPGHDSRPSGRPRGGTMETAASFLAEIDSVSWGH